MPQYFRKIEKLDSTEELWMMMIEIEELWRMLEFDSDPGGARAVVSVNQMKLGKGISRS